MTQRRMIARELSKDPAGGLSECPRMGTKILQRRLPDWKVVRCERIEDALLWEKFSAKRAQLLGDQLLIHVLLKGKPMCRRF